MMFLDPQNVYHSTELNQFAWLEHGFGTSLSTEWPGRPAVSVKQIHSNQVLVSDGAPGQLGEGDALVSAAPGCLLAVRTADCLPILIVDPENRAVAAVHAGWRGTVGAIVQNAVEAMRVQFGSREGDLVGVIGPGIGSCCFEVGPEVAGEFRRSFPERLDLDTRTRIDLAEANRRQLCQVGVRLERIVTAGLCTCCGREFHSYRRDRDAAGRMVAAIGIRA